jgi:hypothetical protein
MPRLPNTRPTSIYWLFDMRPETLVEWPKGRPFYCGKSIYDPPSRLRDHRASARKYPNRLISIWLNNCTVHVRVQTMEIVPPDGDWRERERFWIHTIRLLHPGGANIANGGEGAPGLIHTPDTRMKIGKASSARKRTPFSEEARARMSAAHLGKKLGPRSPEHNAKFQRRCSDETREKISAALKGKKRSAAHRAKLSATLTGRKLGAYSAEHRAKISAAKKGKPGRPHSEETRVKLSIATRARYEKLRASNA